MGLNFPLVTETALSELFHGAIWFFDILYYSRIKKVYLQVGLLGPGHLEEDYPITTSTFFRKQNIVRG